MERATLSSENSYTSIKLLKSRFLYAGKLLVNKQIDKVQLSIKIWIFLSMKFFYWYKTELTGICKFLICTALRLSHSNHLCLISPRSWSGLLCLLKPTFLCMTHFSFFFSVLLVPCARPSKKIPLLVFSLNVHTYWNLDLLEGHYNEKYPNLLSVIPVSQVHFCEAKAELPNFHLHSLRSSWIIECQATWTFYIRRG